MILALLLVLAPQWSAAAPERSPHAGATGGAQGWSRAAYAHDGSIWTAWSGSNEVWARRFDAAQQPTGPIMHVNTTTKLQQDEVELAVDVLTGNALVAWSDRSSTYTDYMNACAAVLKITGGFVRAEFSLSDLTTFFDDASRWRPLVIPLRWGGFAATWTGTWDEEAVLRLFNGSGQPLTPDLILNEPSGARQDFPCVSESKFGTLLTVWQLGSGYYPDDLWCAMLDASGTHIQDESKLTPFPLTNYHEVEPRLASNVRGYTVMVCYAGGDSWAALYGPGFTPRKAPWRVGVGMGWQRDPKVAIDAEGNFLVAWEDNYWNRIDFAWFDSNGVELQRVSSANQFSLGPKISGEKGRRQVNVSLSADGKRMLLAWSGASLVAGHDIDAYFREFTRP